MILLPNPKSLGSLDFAVILVFISFISYLVFHRYEPRRPMAIFSLLVLTPSALSVLSASLHNKLGAIFATFISYWLLISLFTVIYRLSPSHPLAKYPGPILHKISKLQSAQVAWKANIHCYYRELHLRYGDIVRVGPNELSYCNVDGIQQTMGFHGLPKGPFYENRHTKVPSLSSMTDPVLHTIRRRPWTSAFNSTALKEYHPLLAKRSRELIDALAKRTSESVDISKWMEYFAFDFMGDMAFSFSFDMMKEGGDTFGYWNTMTGTVQLTNFVAQTPWAMKFIRDFINPGGTGSALFDLSQKMVGQRLKAGSMSRDLLYHLNNEGKEAAESDPTVLISDGTTAIVAGSDTTSTALSSLWYYLLRNPGCYARLRDEVDAVFPPTEEPLDLQKLSGMPYLHACINETMRLLPPVPSGSQRAIRRGTGGKMVGPHFIPEGNNVLIHTYSLHRDPRYFSPYPDTFWPDRWLAPEIRRSLDGINKPLGDNVEVIHDTRAFIPFSIGPRICVGKGLAMNEIRVVVSSIVQRFDMKVAGGYDLDEWERTLEDHFVMKKGKLPVVLTERA